MIPSIRTIQRGFDMANVFFSACARTISSVFAPVMLAGVALAGFAASDATAGANAPGGADYAWYQVANCSREPYGVIANYNSNSSVINQQLGLMYQNGQRRLRIPIFHGRGLNTGTVMDSTGGNLSLQNRQNLTNFLTAVKNAGFAEIEVAFFPTGPNSPANWTQYSEDYYQENWNVIYNLHSIIASAGIPYRIDLLNEGAPATNQPALLQYAQHLWNDYNFVFGKNDTLGFSVIPTTDRLQNMPAVYGNSQYGNHGTPYLYDMHFYDHSAASFVNAANIMKAKFPPAGWILGEAYYNDPAQADALNQGIAQTGQTVFYLTQWPLSYGSTCSDVDVVPLNYGSYSSRGF